MATLRIARKKAGYRMRGAWIQAIALHWPLVCAPLLALSILDGFPYASLDARYSDLAVSHYPNAIFLLRALAEWKQLPLWSPAILGGYPFAANPLAGLWYPPGWLALAFPLPFGFNLAVSLHLLWGGLGIYLLLREQGLGRTAGLCGALAFQAMPKLFAHYGAGHLTLVYAVTWTPWLLWAWLRANPEEGYTGKTQTRNLLPGVVLGLTFLADPRWAAYAGGLWWAWAFAHSQRDDLWKTLKKLAGQTLLAAVLAAPLALPLLEYTLLSTRATLSAAETAVFSLPPARLLGLFFPGIQGNHEWALYPGALVLLLSASALVTASSQITTHRKTASSMPESSLRATEKARREIRFWTGMAFLAILLSLGESLPGYELITRLPGFGLLRVPARALFIAHLAFSVLAANGLEGMLAGYRSQERRRVWLALLALSVFPLGLAAGGWLMAGELPAGFAWGAAVFLAGACWLGIRLLFSTKTAPGAWMAGLVLLGLLDLGTVDLQSFATRNRESVFEEGEAAAAYLAAQPGFFRVYSPSYSLPQQTAARYGLELADGVDPLQLEILAEFMEEASGVPRDGYSVTLPSFRTGSPQDDNRAYLPDPERLGWLNVAYILSEYDLTVSGLRLRERFGDTRVYENTAFRPRAWVQMKESGEIDRARPARVDLWSPNRITLTASGPGLLVLSEVAYPGWEVWIDGERAEIELANHLFRSVYLGAGQHQVGFRYRPASLFTGLPLTSGAILFLAARWLSTRRDKKIIKV